MTPHLPIFLAFAAAFFFGPIVKKKLSDYEDILTREERDFVLSYCSLGTMLLICAVCGFVFGLVLPVGSWIHTSVAIIIPCIISFMLAWASYQILREKSWSWFNLWSIPDEMKSMPTQGDLKRIIVDFLPGWSVWQRFVYGHWKINYRWTKEAMIVRTLWAVQHLIIGASRLSGLIFFLVLARIATLRANLDFVPQQWKQRINTIVGTSIFDFFVRSVCWLLGRMFVFFNRPSLSWNAITVVSSTETKPSGRYVPHIIMIILCIWGLGQYWITISLSLWGVWPHATSIAWLLLLIHPFAMLKAGLFFPPFHRLCARCHSYIDRLIPIRKTNTDVDENV